MDGNLEKLFAVLQANLQPNGYRLEDSAYDPVSNLLNTKTRPFVNKIKAKDNGKRKQRKKVETWMKLLIDPQERVLKGGGEVFLIPFPSAIL